MKDIFKKDLDVLRGKVQKCIIDTAKDAFTEVVNFSPEPMNSKKGYSLGSYVLSHRVSLDGSEDKSITLIEDEDKAAALKAMARKKDITKALVVVGTDVIISNNIDYADEVEFEGWRWTEPYATYSKASAIAYLRASVRAAAV